MKDHLGDDDLRFSELSEQSSASDDEGRPSAAAVEPQGSKHVKELRSALGLDAIKVKSDRRKERKRRAKERKRLRKASSFSGLVQTRASKMMSGQSDLDVVVFNDPAKTSKGSTVTLPSSAEANDKSITLMKDARHEVFKLGISCMNKSQREDAELENLIRLGAKPPKNTAMPYKEYKQKMREEKEEERRRKQELQSVGMLKVNSRRPSGKTSKKKQKDSEPQGEKRKRSKGGSLQAKLSKFDGGMLKISAADIAKVRNGK